MDDNENDTIVKLKKKRKENDDKIAERGIMRIAGVSTSLVLDF